MNSTTAPHTPPASPPRKLHTPPPRHPSSSSSTDGLDDLEALLRSADLSPSSSASAIIGFVPCKPRREPQPQFWLGQPGQVYRASNGGVYALQGIGGVRVKDGQREYAAMYPGCSLEASTWEPESSFHEEDVKAYEILRKGGAKKRSEEKNPAEVRQSTSESLEEAFAKMGVNPKQVSAEDDMDTTMG